MSRGGKEILTRWLVLACLTASWAGPSVATVYEVRPDGFGDFPTIQAAIEGAVDGDVIELTNGVFLGEGNRDVDYGRWSSARASVFPKAA